MSLRRTVLVTATVWAAAVTALHLWLNLRLPIFAPGQTARGEDKFRVGFLPVT